MTVKEMCEMFGLDEPETEEDEEAIVAVTMNYFYKHHAKKLNKIAKMKEADQMMLMSHSDYAKRYYSKGRRR